MFNKKEKDKYYDFSVDLYTHGIINDKEIKDIKNKYDNSKETKNRNDDFELQVSVCMNLINYVIMNNEKENIYGK